MYSFSFTTAVCGFHIYKDVWETTIAGVSFILTFLVTNHLTRFSSLGVTSVFIQLAIDHNGKTFDNGPD